MYYSMTGYAKSMLELPEKQITVEIKSLNSKATDINIRMPQYYKEKEIEIRKMLSEVLLRGKIEFYITVDLADTYTDVEFNKEVIKNYSDQLKNILTDYNLSFNEEIFRSVLSLPNVYKRNKEELNDEEWNKLKTVILEVAQKLMSFRLTEGLNLEKQILDDLKSIEDLLSDVEKYETERVEHIKEKILKQLNSLETGYDKERFEQELIYYIEKIDISEEKTRLKSHIKYFREVSESKETAKGKKLTFIAQEIGREINTLGVKSSHKEIQKTVVKMKDHLERIKEQLANIL